MNNLVPQFTELVRVKIEDNLDLVFSIRADGYISVAQQRWVIVRGRRQGMWVKNALITNDRGIEEAAEGFRACLDILLELREKAKSNGKIAEEAIPQEI